MKKLLLLVLLVTGCSTVPLPDEMIGDDKYKVNQPKVLWVSLPKKYEKVVSDAEFATELDREEARAELDNEKQQKRWCNYLMIGSLVLSGIFALVAWFTHHVWKYGGASVVMAGFAAGAAAFTEVIRVVHSPFIIWGLIALVISFVLLHRVSLKDLWEKWKAK
jgi:hypothetical protein